MYGAAKPPTAAAPTADPRASGAPAPPPRIAVLVVDDDRLTRRVLRRTLERMGCRVDEALDGGEGVDKVARAGYDLVFMDQQMPTMDGLTATRCIRALPPPNRNVPIVGVSGTDTLDTPMGALARGMDDWLAKPFHRSDVEAVLRRVLGVTQDDGAARAAGTPPPGGEGPAADGASIPPEIVRAVGSFGEGCDFLAEVLGAFEATAPEALDRLVDAVAAGDATRAAFQSHALQGMVGNIGLSDLQERFAYIERAARAGLIEDAAAATHAAARTLRMIVRRVGAWLAANAPTVPGEDG